MAFKLNGGSPVDMLRTVLTGPSSREPNRRSNAVMRSILHDSGSKFINIDPLFYFIQSHMELALPKLLGQTVGDALGYTHLADTPTQLKDLAAIIASLVANEALKLNLHLLAVIPCMKKRFPKQAAFMVGFARPYAFQSKHGGTGSHSVCALLYLLFPRKLGSCVHPRHSCRTQLCAHMSASSAYPYDAHHKLSSLHPLAQVDG